MNAAVIVALLLLSVLAFGCAEEQAAAPAAPVVQESVSTQQVEEGDKMGSKRILMIIAPDGFRDEEFIEPKKVFEGAGAEVTVASKGVKTAKGKLGATADVDIDVSSADAADYDAVVFIGGPGTTVYFDDPAALKLAKDAYAAGKVTAAICIAPSILANAGVLREHKATCFESEAGNVGSKSKGYTGEDVTVDGNVVTANGPAAAKKFGEAIVRLLS